MPGGAVIGGYLYLAAAAAVLAGLAWGGRALHQAGAAGVRLEWAASDARVLEEQRLQARERAATFARIDHDTTIKARTARADAVGAAAAGVGLRFRAQAVAAACDSGPASPGDPAPGPGALLADLQQRLEEAGRELAAIADDRGIAGQACQDAYGAVSARDLRLP